MCFTPRTAGSQSALERSLTTAKAVAAGTGSLAVALASIIGDPQYITVANSPCISKPTRR